ncbi:MAG: hypothetical protein Ct9H90mP27_2680 [Gammaproteobacteria bacterium]|nr:MAG: hypothetical protein Ct9H90mP27_2680 [Gammaproteobacteria bacterium]
MPSFCGARTYWRQQVQTGINTRANCGLYQSDRDWLHVRPRSSQRHEICGPVRQELSIRTMMNILGPMTNPAQAKRQVIGVFAREWQEKIARVLQMLGSVHALVVHSEGLEKLDWTRPHMWSNLKMTR